MNDSIPQRVAGIAAIVLVVTLVVSGFVLQPSGMPKPNDAAAKWASFIAEHRSRLEVSSVLEKNNEVRRFAVQQTGLAKQKQLRKIAYRATCGVSSLCRNLVDESNQKNQCG